MREQQWCINHGCILLGIEVMGENVNAQGRCHGIFTGERTRAGADRGRGIVSIFGT